MSSPKLRANTPEMPEAAATAGPPDALPALEAAFGPASSAGFGSAVFHAPLAPATDLEQAAFAHYRAFVGPLWDRFGAAAWTDTWRAVYRRPAAQPAAIVAELEQIADADAASAIDLLLHGRDDADAAQRALEAVYNDPAVVDLRVFTIGDGAALSGVVIAGRRGDATEVSLVFLMD